MIKQFWGEGSVSMSTILTTQAPLCTLVRGHGHEAQIDDRKQPLHNLRLRLNLHAFPLSRVRYKICLAFRLILFYKTYLFGEFGSLDFYKGCLYGSHVALLGTKGHSS